ncbi:hypothetical protein D3C72_1358160 [compost metagenome]
MHSDVQQHRRDQRNGEHVAPDERTVEQVRQTGAGDVGQALPGDDHQLALADQPTAVFRGRQLGDQYRNGR